MIEITSDAIERVGTLLADVPKVQKEYLPAL